MIKKIQKITGLLLILLMIMSQSSYADDYEPADEEDNASNTLILDADDTGGNVTLQFGESLAEFLRWNSGNASFDLSDETLTLDASNAGAGANVSIIANQGSDNDGELRYNASTNQWELSNDGGSFNAIATGSGGTDLATAQLRETGGFAIGTSYADVDFDTVDEESDSATIDADATSDDFTISENGYYQITYDFSMDNGAVQDVDMRVRVNGTTTVNGSESSAPSHTALTVGAEITQSLIAQLSSSDVITLQIQASAAGITTEANGIFTITKLEGVTGPQGPTGPAGPGDLDDAYDNFGAAASTITIDASESQTGGLVFLGSLAADETVTISNSANGGGLLVENTGTGDSLRVNDAASDTTPFVVDDAGQIGIGLTTPASQLDIQGTGEQVELGDGSAADSFINFDDGANRNFGWDDSAGAISTFDQQFRFRTIQSSTPPETCGAAFAGMQWMDTDTGITYVCDTSNSRNKWLSVSEMVIFGDESGSCPAGSDANSNTNCNVDWGNGLGPDGSTDLGFYIPYDVTITGYGFSADNDACTSGNFDVEVWGTGSNSDDNGYSFEADVASALNGQAHNSNTSNVDIVGNQYTVWGIDNNCGQAIDDFAVMLFFRYRHD